MCEATLRVIKGIRSQDECPRLKPPSEEQTSKRKKPAITERWSRFRVILDVNPGGEKESMCPDDQFGFTIGPGAENG